jgi:hypothetical protein
MESNFGHQKVFRDGIARDRPRPRDAPVCWPARASPVSPGSVSPGGSRPSGASEATRRGQKTAESCRLPRPLPGLASGGLTTTPQANPGSRFSVFGGRSPSRLATDSPAPIIDHRPTTTRRHTEWSTHRRLTTKNRRPTYFCKGLLFREIPASFASRFPVFGGPSSGRLATYSPAPTIDHTRPTTRRRTKPSTHRRPTTEDRQPRTGNRHILTTLLFSFRFRLRSLSPAHQPPDNPLCQCVRLGVGRI